MRTKWLGRIGLTALVMGVVGSSSGMVGCAAERDPINRVQLNAIPKSFLVGNDYSNPADDPEFYARSMVVKVPYGESSSDTLMVTNTINSMSKIKWQIQESELIGRVSFERIDGTDTQGLTPTATAERDPNLPLAQNAGVVVFAYKIEKQFDIRRAYNSQTGEESNVVEENDSDRSWNDRDYVRVDFSKNLVTTSYDFDTLALLGVYNGIEYSPMEFDIRNPDDIDAPQFDLDKGYFDVTNKVFANPKMLDLGWGKLPGCMLPNIIAGGTEPAGNCNPNELTIRASFKKVVDTDYEPIDWDGQKFEAYGAFTVNRQGYARDYGLVDAKWKRFINRYNIWERNHAYTNVEKMEGATACKLDSECSTIGAVPGMSHCDTYSAKCTMPFKDRVAKPIVWHYADGSPEMYFDSTREATEEWDTAMRGAVAVAKYAECKRFTPGDDCGSVISGNFAEEEDALYLTKEINACKRGDIAGTPVDQCDALADSIGAQRNYSEAVISLAKARPMVILCHSPVTDKDAKECGDVGTIARLGDLRHHLVTGVATPETNSPWGIMSDSNDPVTGEHVSASINIWTHVNDLFSRGLVDTLRYIGGELKTEDVTDGKYIDQWVEAARTSKGTGLTPLMGQDEVDKRIAAVAGTTVEKMNAAAAVTKANLGKGRQAGNAGMKLREALVAQLKRVGQTKAAYDAPSVNAPLYQSRMNLAKGTSVEAAIATPAMQQLAQSTFGGVALDNATKVQATSIMQGLNPQMRRSFEQRKEMSLAARGACIMNFEATAPLGYVALGDILQEKFGKFNVQDPANVQAERADKMKDYLRRRAQYAVIAHEMGHSIALRHNFVSSSDAWNFRPQYWQLRTNDKALSATPCKEDGTSDGKTCVGPRWLDAVSQNEQKNMLTMWAQSSTMEYPGEPSQDLLGIGAYDFGAARMFYGQAATVYTDSRFKQNQEPGLAAQAHQDEFGGLLGYSYGGDERLDNYSQLDSAYNLIEKCSPVDTNNFKPASWNDAKDGAWNAVLDGHIVSNEQGKATKCTQPKVDFVQWDTLKDADGKTHAADAKSRVRVPHGFASDDWADLGNIAVYRHDNGADIYETMHFWIAQQEMTHIFTNYRRGRRDFSIWGAFNRTQSRYHEKMRDSAKAIGLYITLARDQVTQYNTSASNDPYAFVAEVLKANAASNTVASSIAFDHFAHVFSRPQPGDHGKIGTGDTVLRSFEGTGLFAPDGRAALSVANGVTGGFGTISLGGRPIENALATDKGRDYDRDFTLNVGSYYEKAFTAMLFTESADNFISASRDDFVDPRFRSVSVADVFPDGYRRWIGNNLTGDDTIKGVFARGTGGTGPQPADLDPNGYALLGQTSWWPTQGMETCFPAGEKLTCRDPFATTAIGTQTNSGPVIDPQVGWEQQKFALIQSLIYLPENGRVNWVDQMRVYEMGVQSDPGFENRIEFHNPDGHIYVAQTYGTEVLYGKTVQKGVAARVLEYANELLQKGVVTTPIYLDPTKPLTSPVVGYKPVLDAAGNVQYKSDGAAVSSCENSRDCLKMKNYTAVPKLMREAMGVFGWSRGTQDLKGVY